MTREEIARRNHSEGAATAPELQYTYVPGKAIG
jgi:hypothetical protein